MAEPQHIPEFIARNIAGVRARIARACERSGRRPQDVTLVAVSKTVEVPYIKAAAACGITHFGENRVQEAERKVAALPEVNWHLVGSLQRNKVKTALSLFSCIHSVDRPALVDTLARYAKEPPVSLLLQVNVSGEETKHGASLAEAPHLARLISAAGLPLVGLMAIAPLACDPEQARPVFRELRLLALRLQDMGLPGADIRHLSMGMSGDLEVAVEEGATLVRVGSAIFGPREA